MVSKSDIERLVVAMFVVVGSIAFVLWLRRRFWRDAVPEYTRTELTLYRVDDTKLSTIEVRIADTDLKHYVGLSATDELADDEGMLFVHPEERTQAYVMREMSFPLDIVFIDADGRVTTIHRECPPASHDEGTGSLQQYRGRAKYVLELPGGFADRSGFDEGARVEIPSDTD
jgi:uncharacterized membrane protein (UPF0127 family)